MLIVEHPSLAQRSCDDCRKYVYERENSEPKQWPPGTGQPMLRPANSPTPCETCPKCFGWDVKSPEMGKLSELSEKNQRALAVFHQVQATHGRCLTQREATDPVLSRNLGIIQDVLERDKRRRADRAERKLEMLLSRITR
jgi:hypothetical protein